MTFGLRPAVLSLLVGLLGAVRSAPRPEWTAPQPNAEGALVAPLYKAVHHRSAPYIERFGDDPVNGDIWPLAIFWMYIGIGTPSAPFSVAIDTGSSDLDVPYYQCATCVHGAPNHAYQPSNSSTSEPYPCDGTCDCGNGNQCDFSNTYQTCDPTDPSASCTITGLLWNDMVSVAPATGSVQVQFGSITYQTSNFQQFQTVDGVMGLAGPPGNYNVFQSLVAAGYLKSSVFAMCFVSGSVSNGTITLGGLDSRLYTGDIVYSPNVGAEYGYYGLELSSIGITVGNKTVAGSPAQQAVLDSGTNVLLLPSGMFDSFHAILSEMAGCGGDSDPVLPGVCPDAKGRDLFTGYCYNLTQSQIALFPDIVLNTQSGIRLNMRPRTYLLQGENSAGTYCLGVLPTDDLLIIGDTTMEEFYVVFDTENQNIGFAPVNREFCGSV